jgi:AbiV family abortive infection protein
VNESDLNERLGFFAEAAQKVLENATELHAEARLLQAAGALSRALLLFQISLEECAKIEMLGAWAVSTLLSDEVDTKALMRAFADHKAKNRTNAYMLPLSEDERAARERGEWDVASGAFKEMQRTFHQESNTAKNAALYVDFANGRVKSPKDQITASMVDRTASTNEDLLPFAAAKTAMLETWSRQPKAVLGLFQGMKDVLQGLRQSAGTPDEALAVPMDNLLERAAASGYSEKMAAGQTEGDVTE